MKNIYTQGVVLNSTRARLSLIGVALCAALFVFVGCPDGNGTNPIDIDGDLLIDINTLEELNAMRHSLDGTSYRASAGGTEFLCGTDAATACIGYELLGSLDFADGASYASSTVNLDWRPTGGGTAIVATDSATNAGWEPIGSCNTDADVNEVLCADGDDTPFTARFDGGGFTISNLYARNVETNGAGMGLFGISSGTIAGIGIVDANIYGGAGDNDIVGGLLGFSTTSGTIIASYATGNADGGAGIFDIVGGLAGYNGGTIIASYATGSVDGGTDASDIVGGLVGFFDVDNGTITASYGFGMATGNEATIDVATINVVTRSADASDATAVANACALTVALSSTTPANRWDTAQWDFGTAVERPVVLYNNALVLGQTDRGC